MPGETAPTITNRLRGRSNELVAAIVANTQPARLISPRHHRSRAAPSRNSTTSESTRWRITAIFAPSGDTRPSKLMSADAIRRGVEPSSGRNWMLVPPSLRTG